MKMPVIVVTGLENESSAKEKALEEGVTDFISKPFNSTEIKARAHAHANYQRDKQLLEQQTSRDLLTGLLDNTGLSLEVEKAISFSSRHHENLTVIAVRLYQFEEIFYV